MDNGFEERKEWAISDTWAEQLYEVWLSKHSCEVVEKYPTCGIYNFIFHKEKWIME